MQEIDYLNEGRNADRFRRNFQGVDWVESPVVHWGYTSARVITLSYLPGIKVSCHTLCPAVQMHVFGCCCPVLSFLWMLQVRSPVLQITNIQQLSAAGIDTGAIARRATEAYLLQILRHGFLHAGASQNCKYRDVLCMKVLQISCA